MRRAAVSRSSLRISSLIPDTIPTAWSPSAMPSLGREDWRCGGAGWRGYAYAWRYARAGTRAGRRARRGHGVWRVGSWVGAGLGQAPAAFADALYGAGGFEGDELGVDGGAGLGCPLDQVEGPWRRGCRRQ